MFKEFEIVCPRCKSTLWLSADGYQEYIKEADYVETKTSNTRYYNVLCLGCETKLTLSIETRIGERR